MNHEQPHVGDLVSFGLQYAILVDLNPSDDEAHAKVAFANTIGVVRKEEVKLVMRASDLLDIAVRHLWVKRHRPSLGPYTDSNPRYCLDCLKPLEGDFRYEVCKP